MHPPCKTVFRCVENFSIKFLNKNPTKLWYQNILKLAYVQPFKYSHDCHIMDYPDVYAKVTEVLDWILENVDLPGKVSEIKLNHEAKVKL